VNWLHPLYLTTTMLVIAYVIMFLPLAVSSEYVGLARAARSYEQIARSLGDTPLRSTLRITLPLALPGVAVGALLVLIEVEKELTTTLLLHPTGTDTLSTALWATTNGEVLDFTAAAPYGVTLMLLAAIPAAILARRTLAQVD
jgi:iron(III) transport system permease protein